MYSKTKNFLLVLLLLWSIPMAAMAAEEKNYEQASSTVKIVAGEYTKNGYVVPYGSGSATVLTADGIILTNHHVVEKDEDEVHNALYVCISFHAQEEPACEYTALYIASNKDMDVALLKIEPEDIYGNPVPKLPFLTYQHEIGVTEGDTLEVRGYPDTGGESITFTKGQVSGFYTNENDHTWIKTDADISFGNSGGTAVKKVDGIEYLVGVPSKVAISADALGYVLDIADAREWIDIHITDIPEKTPKIREQLHKKLQIEKRAKEEKQYVHPEEYEEISFSWQLPRSWEFTRISRTGWSVLGEIDGTVHEINLSLDITPFEITDEYLEEAVFEKVEKNKDDLPSYNREKTEFLGVPAYLLSWVAWDSKVMNYLIPYGDALLYVQYSYPLKEADQEKGIYAAVFEGFELSPVPASSPKKKQLHRNTPPFSVDTPNGWYLLENVNPRNEDFIASFSRPDNIEGEMRIFHYERSEADKLFSQEEYLEDWIKGYQYSEGFRLLHKDANVQIDGLLGVSLVYSSPSDEASQTQITAIVHIFDGDNYYALSYSDVSENYDMYVADFKTLLSSFKNRNEESQSSNGLYRIGSLRAIFKDIAHHAYEEEISKLHDRGVIRGYPNGTFLPERTVTRAEALKTILAAKENSDEKRGNTSLQQDIEVFGAATFQTLDFEDTRQYGDMRPYLRYARDKKFISGYGNNLFAPQQQVTLAELCKILFTVYEIPVWNSDISYFNGDWYVPYMQKAFELQIIPYGVYEPEHIVKRGELAYMVIRMLDYVER